MDSSDNNRIKLVKAVYNFKGSNNDELCFHKDDIITLTQTPEGGWWEGTFNSVTGWFPSNYVEPIFSYEEDLANPFAMTNDFEIHQYRHMVFKDIVDTEAAYIKDLKETLNKYLIPLQQTCLISEPEISLVIRSIQDICTTHGQFLSTLSSLNTSNHKDLRIGGIFLEFAPQIKSVHFEYCTIHAKFVNLIEQYKKELTNLYSGLGADVVCGTVQLTTCLSISFRRLDKYPALLQELQRYTDESHVDRGDTQRAGFVYREIAMSCLELRRQKEMELEVLLGNIKKWDGNETVESLGEIIKMGPVSLHQQSASDIKKDRYLVLFPHTLLLLSVSFEMTSFVFEAKFKLEEISIRHLNEDEKTIEIEMRDKTNKYHFHCSSSDDAKNWMTQIRKCMVTVPKLNARANTPVANQFYETQRKIQSSSISDSSSSSNIILSTPQRAGSLRNRFWNTKSLIPHPPVRISIASSNTSCSQIERSGSENKQANKLNSDDDMAILQVIESYCFSRKNPKVNSNSNDPLQIVVTEDEPVESIFKDEHEKGIAETVYLLQEEVKQLKLELKLLTDGLRAERRARKKLKAVFVERYQK